MQNQLLWRLDGGQVMAVGSWRPEWRPGAGPMDASRMLVTEKVFGFLLAALGHPPAGLDSHSPPTTRAG
jgi:hypothetical protein